MSALGYPSDLTPEQREALRAEDARRMKARIEDRLYELADDIGRGYNRMKDWSDAEVVAYANGVRHSLEWLAELHECAESPGAFLQIQGALGERYRRTNSPAGKLKRRLFQNLIDVIRDKRIAMLDRYESLDYATEFKVWQARVWALERKGIAREEWDEFNMLQRELRAVWELSHHLITLPHWTAENWKRRSPQPQEAQVAA